MQQFSSRGDQPSKGQQGIMIPILQTPVALPVATFSAHNDLIGNPSAPAAITSSSWSAWKLAVIGVALGLVAVTAWTITLSVIAGTQHGQIKNLQESGAPCHNCTGSGTGATGASGASGAIIEMSFNGTGPSGVSGSTGSTGPSGFTGASGSSGGSGFTGGSGFSGPSGGSGLTGATGGIGTSGGTGASGRSGPTGSTGSSGVSGVSGVTGVSGVSGATGGTGALPTLNGDVQGPITSNTIVNLQGNPVNAMTPPSSSVLFYNNSQWAPLTATPTATASSVCLRDQLGNTTFNEVTTEGVWSSNPWINLGFGGQGLGMGPQLNQSWIKQSFQYSFYSFWRTDYIGSTTNVSAVDAGTGVAVQLPGTLPIPVQQSTVSPSGVVWVTDYVRLYALDTLNVSNSQLLCSNLPYNTTCCLGSEPNIFHAIDDHVLLSSVDWTYFNVTSCSIISSAGYFVPAFDPSQPWNGVSIDLYCTSNAGNGIVVGDFAYCWQGQLPVFGYPHAIFRKRIYPPYDESYLPGTYFFADSGFYGFPISWFPFCYQGRAWPVMYLYGVNPAFSEVDPETGKFYPSPLSVVNATTLSSMPYIWSMSDTKYCRYPDYKTSVYGATEHGHRSIYNVSVITTDRIEPTDGRNGFCPNPNTCPPQYTSTGNLNIYNATSGGHLVFGQNSTDLYPNAQNNLQSTNEIVAKRHTPLPSAFASNIINGPGVGTGAALTVIGQYSDCRMKLSYLIGTSPANSAIVFSVVYAHAWTSTYTPGIQITAANAITAQDISKVFISAESATGFSMSVGPIALTAATTYTWNIQTC